MRRTDQRGWEMATTFAALARENRRFEPPSGHEPVTSVAFSPDGKRIAHRQDDKTAKVWDARDRPANCSPSRGTQEHVTSVAFSPDGKRIVTGSWDKTAKVWDAETGTADVLTFKGHTGGRRAWRSAPTASAIVTGQ